MKALTKSALIFTWLLASNLVCAAPAVVKLANYDWEGLTDTDRYNHQVGKNSFLDLIHFRLDAESARNLKAGSTYDLTFDLNRVNGSFAPDPEFGFRLYYGSPDDADELLGAKLVNGSNLGGFSEDLVASGLTYGDYTLSVFGKGQATASKYEVASIGIAPHAAASVPEPGTCAMLLAGLGLMGAVARRRRQA